MEHGLYKVYTERVNSHDTIVYSAVLIKSEVLDNRDDVIDKIKNRIEEHYKDPVSKVTHVRPLNEDTNTQWSEACWLSDHRHKV